MATATSPSRTGITSMQAQQTHDPDLEAILENYSKGDNAKTAPLPERERIVQNSHQLHFVGGHDISDIRVLKGNKVCSPTYARFECTPSCGSKGDLPRRMVGAWLLPKSRARATHCPYPSVPRTPKLFKDALAEQVTSVQNVSGQAQRILSDVPLDIRRLKMLESFQEAAAAKRMFMMVCAASKDCRNDDTIIYASSWIHQVTGFRSAYFIGCDCRVLQGEKTDQRTVSQIRDALIQHKPCQALVLNYRKDGTPWWNMLHINPLKDAHGHVVAILGVQKDVTSVVLDALRRCAGAASVERSAPPAEPPAAFNAAPVDVPCAAMVTSGRENEDPRCVSLSLEGTREENRRGLDASTTSNTDGSSSTVCSVPPAPLEGTPLPDAPPADAVPRDSALISGECEQGVRRSSRHQARLLRMEEKRRLEAEKAAQDKAAAAEKRRLRDEDKARRRAQTKLGLHEEPGLRGSLQLAPRALEVLKALTTTYPNGSGSQQLEITPQHSDRQNPHSKWLEVLVGDAEIKDTGSAYMRAYGSLLNATSCTQDDQGTKREWSTAGDSSSSQAKKKARGGGGGRKATQKKGGKATKAGAGKSKSAVGDRGSARKCGRCGRPNHTSRTCSAKTHADGHTLKTINCPRCLRPTHAHLGPCDFKTDIKGRKISEPPYLASTKRNVDGSHDVSPDEFALFNM